MSQPADENDLVELPSELFGDPDPSTVDPPVDTLADRLPLHQLPWEDFERLCVALLKDVEPEAVVRLYGVKGDDQEGIDLYSHAAEEDIVVQCRKVKEMGPAAIKGAVDDFLDGIWAAKAKTFILATPQDLASRLRADAVIAQTSRLEKLENNFIAWDDEALATLLRERPTIVKRFFGVAWTERFCGKPDLTDAPIELRELPPRPAVFEGRADELNAIAEGLPAGRGAAIALHGLSGAGKSTLATQFVHEAKGYGVVIWLAAPDDAELEAQLAGLADRLHIAPPNATAPERAATAKSYLAENGNWLVVIDGAEGPAGIQRQLRAGEGGHLLVTSQRHGGWRAIGITPIPIETLADDDAIELLLRTSGSKNRDSAAETCQLLGNLPIAVAQAGAYVDATAIGLDELLDLLESDPTPILEKRLPHLDRAVSRLWEIAFDAVEDVCAQAAELLYMCAWLGTGDIPDDMQRELTGVEHPKVLEIRKSLLRFSLVTPRDGAVTLHPLVARAARTRADSTSRHVDRAIAVLSDRLRERGAYSGDRAGLERDAAHAKALIEHVGDERGDDRGLGTLMTFVADHLLRLARPADARDLLQRAALVLSEAQAPVDQQIGVINDFGIALRDLGEVANAEGAFTLSLHLKQEHYGGDSPTLVSTLTNLATVQQQQGEHNKALETIDRALGILAKIPDADPVSIGQLHGNRGNIFLDLRKPAKALREHQEALNWFERVTSPPATELAAAHANVANALLDNDDAEGAVKENRLALDLKKAVFGEAHPTVGDTLANMANALRAAEELGEAEQRANEALKIHLAWQPADLRAIAGAQHALGLVLVHQRGRSAEGVDLLRQSISAAKRVYPDEHPQLIGMRHNLELAEEMRAEVTHRESADNPD